MIRTKGEAGTGDIVEAVRHMRAVQDAIRKLQTMPEDELVVESRDMAVSLELLTKTRELGRMPVVNFAAGGVATPADAALMMQLGADGVFVGSGIFKSGNPATRAHAIVQAVTHYNNPEIIAEVSKDLGEAMVGISTRSIPQDELLAPRSI
jgi:pyridoxal 5'-phosphate synthase pdxS subunit